jgi:hypothetical protein
MEAVIAIIFPGGPSLGGRGEHRIPLARSAGVAESRESVTSGLDWFSLLM